MLREESSGCPGDTEVVIDIAQWVNVTNHAAKSGR